jgi:hypothetical protein
MGRVAAAFVIVTAFAWGILSLIGPAGPVIHVRWKPAVTDAQRVALERQFRLKHSVHSDGTTWKYELADSSTANVQAIVHNEYVEDTHRLDRIRYLPEAVEEPPRPILVWSVALGSVAAILLVGLPPVFRRTALLRRAWWSEATAAMSSHASAMVIPSYSPRTTIAAIVAAFLTSVGIAWLAGASFSSAAGALVVVYTCGYVVGSLLVNRTEGLALALIRTVGGLMLSAVAFLLSLVFSVPWFIVPAALLATALGFRGRMAFAWPHEAVHIGWDGAAAGLLVVILLSPIAITFFYMAPGAFPPAFYNVDTAYSLEKVHSLAAAETFPPASLSNLGVRRTYHYGTQAMAALISRSSGLLPHHSLFLIVLPLLTAGVMAAAVAVARHLSPALPRSLTVPLLLISTPSLSRSFWERFGPQLWTAATSREFSIDRMLGESGLWGILSNEAQNVGGDFLILGTIAGIAAARSWGWPLPSFLIGSSILFKTTGGIALVAGFALSEVWRAVVGRRFPSPQLVLAGAIFTATFVAFFLVSFDSAFRVEMYPLEHLRDIARRGGMTGLALDMLWLFLPVLIVGSARIRDSEKRSAPLLLMAIAPVVVMNTTRLVHVGRGGEGAGLDWVQISHQVPFLLHAFALSLASQRWSLLGLRRRAAFLVTTALIIAPVVAAAGSYSMRLLRDPTSGNEFVDNRPIAEALSAIPIEGAIIVTNDLRYPAQNFARDDRQMQIPALFGHQAFAVNFSYEPVEERRELQRLLQRPEWSEAIREAARIHRWTHLVIRKDYVHPAQIPLQQIFENDFYVVFRFP